MKLAMVTQVRNESRRIREWVDFHKSLGFSRFIFFDDKSEDDTRNVVLSIPGCSVENAPSIGRLFDTSAPNSYSGIEDLTIRQKISFRSGLQTLRDEGFDWASCTDVDEFLVPYDVDNLGDYLLSIGDSAPRVYVASYDVKCPFDLSKPVIDQSVFRWSENTRVHGRSSLNGIESVGLYQARGKSLVRLRDWSGEVMCVHMIDRSRFISSGTDLSQFKKVEEDLRYNHGMIDFDNRVKLFHYRNDSQMQIFDQRDERAVDLKTKRGLSC